MTLQSTSVGTSSKLDEERAVGAIVLAFSGDPMIRWLYSDARLYIHHFPEMVKAFAGRAFENGTAYYADGYVGVGLWLPPGVGPDEEGMVAELQKVVPTEQLEMGFSIMEQMGSFHPHEPRWYLPLLGVDPLWQGKGVGSALLKHALAIVDKEGLPAYLESSNALNLRLYERHGFEVMGEIQAGSSPTIWPMLRKPRR